MNSQVGNSRLLAKLARPQNVLYSGLLAVVTARVSGASWSRAIVCYALLGSLYALAAGINNIRDRQIDIANARADNPLASRQIPMGLLYGFFGMHIIAILLLQIWLRQPAALLLSAVYVALLLAYSLPWPSLQSRGFAATLCLALCYGVIPVLLGGSQGSIGWEALAGASSIQLLLLSPLLLAKDYKDIVGDRAYGKRTPLVRYGERGVVIAAGACLVAYVAVIFAAHSLSPMIGSLSLAYIGLVAYVHYRSGQQHPSVARVTYLVLLIISWQLLQTFAF